MEDTHGCGDGPTRARLNRVYRIVGVDVLSHAIVSPMDAANAPH